MRCFAMVMVMATRVDRMDRRNVRAVACMGWLLAPGLWDCLRRFGPNHQCSSGRPAPKRTKRIDQLVFTCRIAISINSIQPLLIWAKLTSITRNLRAHPSIPSLRIDRHPLCPDLRKHGIWFELSQDRLRNPTRYQFRLSHSFKRRPCAVVSGRRVGPGLVPDPPAHISPAQLRSNSRVLKLKVQGG